MGVKIYYRIFNKMRVLKDIKNVDKRFSNFLKLGDKILSIYTILYQRTSIALLDYE